MKNKATTYASALVVKVRRMPTTLLNLLLLTALLKGDGEPVVKEMLAGCLPSIVHSVVKIAVVAIVVEGRRDGELLGKVAQILGVEREGLVFEVTSDVEFSPIVRGGQPNSAFVACSEDFALPREVFGSDFGMAAVWH